MSILKILLDGVLHVKRGESQASRLGRRAAINNEAENPFTPGSKDFLEWVAARNDEREKLLEAQQW